jgi:hypothetical protein
MHCSELMQEEQVSNQLAATTYTFQHIRTQISPTKKCTLHTCLILWVQELWIDLGLVLARSTRRSAATPGRLLLHHRQHLHQRGAPRDRERHTQASQVRVGQSHHQDLPPQAHNFHVIT